MPEEIVLERRRPNTKNTLLYGFLVCILHSLRPGPRDPLLSEGKQKNMEVHIDFIDLHSTETK